MFDLGMTEMLLLGAVALIVVGPGDLPKMMRSVGQYVGQLRSMARQFQTSMNEAAREADLEELRNAGNMMNPRKALTDSVKDALDFDLEDREDKLKASMKKSLAAAEDRKKPANPVVDAPSEAAATAKPATPPPSKAVAGADEIETAAPPR